MKKDNLNVLEKELIRLAKENNMDLNLIKCYDNIIVEFKDKKTDSVDNFICAAMNISSKIGFQEYLGVSSKIEEILEKDKEDQRIDSVEEYIKENQLSMF